MSKIFGLVFNRWVFAVLGLVAISLLIWFVGPLIAVAEYRPLEPEKNRWFLIGLVVFFYVDDIVLLSRTKDLQKLEQFCEILMNQYEMRDYGELS